MSRRLVGGGAVRHVAWGIVGLALLGLFGCNPGEPGTDAGVDSGVPEVCVTAFPENITANYTAEKGCYLVLKTPNLSAGVTVTLKPGVKLVFSPDVAFEFEGEQSLQALGTEQEPILLTASLPVRGHWRGLRFGGTSVASHLAWVTVEYGGYVTGDGQTVATVRMDADSRGVRAGFTHVTMRESPGYGLYASASAVFPEFSQNVLTKNAWGPASLDAVSLGFLDGASTYTGNDKDEFKVRAYRLSAAATWPDLGVPYHFDGSLSVMDGLLTLEPGVRIVMPPQSWFTISGDTAGLVAGGTAEKPIVFTGETETRGAWRGLVFDGSANAANLLRHVVVEWAGDLASDARNAAVKATSDSSGVSLGMDHLTIRQSEGYGLLLGGYAQVPVFAGNVFTQNGLGPARVDSMAAHHLLGNSTYTGNDVDKVYVDAQWVTGSVTWHDLGVPYLLDAKVRPQAVWTLEPGVVLELMAQASIEVGGDAAGFHAAGSALKPIVITGAVKTRGSWDGIRFDNSLNAANELSYCTIEYGGGATRLGWQGMVLTHSDSHGVRVNLTHNTIQHSGVWGVWLNAGQQGTVSDNTYADNAMGDFHREP